MHSTPALWEPEPKEPKEPAPGSPSYKPSSRCKAVAWPAGLSFLPSQPGIWTGRPQSGRVLLTRLSVQLSAIDSIKLTGSELITFYIV